ncbi:hypothetical protein [Teredinibacter turnerae]|uniref:hypothetical protein n=1 Tax=Teredinibacter turnerae TaxID=2426 RepID=UPI000380D5D9|nr:hypothetical protein [Teredinibacter turnerae]
MFRFTAARFFVTLLFFVKASSGIAYPLDPFEARHAPISEFVDWASKQSGKNIILGRGVEGTVSVHVKNLDSTEVLTLFNQVMQSNGYSLKQEEGFYKVILDTEQFVPVTPLYTKLYKLNYLRNTKVRDIFNSVLMAAQTTMPSDGGEKKQVAQISIIKHSVDILPASNALLVSASKEQLKTLDEFVNQIDTDVRQVIIEAVIVETDLGNSEQFGVNLATALTANGFSLISNSLGLTPDISSLDEGGHIVFSQGGDIRGLVSALVKDSHAKILSTPNILVMDRERGNISVGQNVPFLVSREITDGGNTIQQIERKDVGVTLTVTPHVLESGQIVLQISQESSSVTNSTQASDIITNKRSISTVAKVGDGETIALGGLVSDEMRVSNSGVPLLKDIPWLGRLFRSESKDIVQRELTVMIKTIIL